MTEYKRMMISPEVALRILGNNYESNRRINKGNILRIEDEMKSGNFWSENGQTITITKSGKLLNGQHRLTAIVNTGVTLPFLLAIVDDEDADVDLFSTIDIGLPRKPMQMLDCPNKTAVQALAKIMYVMENGSADLSLTVRGMMTNDRASAPSVSAITRYANEHLESLVDAASMSVHVRKVIGNFPQASLGALILLLRYIYADQHLGEFIEDICSLSPKQRISVATARKITSVPGDRRSSEKARVQFFAWWLFGYDKFCQDNDSWRIGKTDKVMAEYNELLQLQRDINRSQTKLFAG